MKELNFGQMEIIHAGSRKGWTCASQVLGGMSTMGGLAAVLALTNPIGWGVLALGAASTIITVALDVDACD